MAYWLSFFFRNSVFQQIEIEQLNLLTDQTPAEDFEIQQPVNSKTGCHQGNCNAPAVLLVAASMRNLGGQSVMAHRLVEDMTRDGIRIDFIPTDPCLPGPLHYLESIKFVRTALRSIVHLCALIRQVPKCDVVHVFSASFSSFLISTAPAILIARLFRRPVILNYHSGEAPEH